MVTIKFTYEVLGEHTHVVVRAGKFGTTLGLCGSLSFRNEEWDSFKSTLHSYVDGSAPADIVLEKV